MQRDEIIASTPMFSVGVGKDPADHPEQSAEDAQKELEGLLRKVVMVEIKDGRRIVGSVNCIDPQGNLIVEHAVEHRGAGDAEQTREVGMVLIPHYRRVRVCLAQDASHRPGGA